MVTGFWRGPATELHQAIRMRWEIYLLSPVLLTTQTWLPWSPWHCTCTGLKAWYWPCWWSLTSWVTQRPWRKWWGTTANDTFLTSSVHYHTESSLDREQKVTSWHNWSNNWKLLSLIHQPSIWAKLLKQKQHRHQTFRTFSQFISTSALTCLYDANMRFHQPVSQLCFYGLYPVSQLPSLTEWTGGPSEDHPSRGPGVWKSLHLCPFWLHPEHVDKWGPKTTSSCCTPNVPIPLSFHESVFCAGECKLLCPTISTWWGLLVKLWSAFLHAAGLLVQVNVPLAFQSLLIVCLCSQPVWSTRRSPWASLCESHITSTLAFL